MKQLINLTATLFVGQFSSFPGTLGSFVGMILWWILLPQTFTNQLALIGGTIILSWISIHFYEKWNHRHDPKEVVIDELVGMWITLLAVPKQAFVFILGFLLFRIFDIWKPSVIGWIDRKVPGASGTLFDDVLAGLLACGVLNFLLILGRHFGIIY